MSLSADRSAGMGLGPAVTVLLALGACWGVSMPITKVATSTGHGVFGLIFWQLVVVATALLAFLVVRRRPFRVAGRHLRLLLTIALIGTIIPNSMSYVAVANLPAGVHSITMSLVPMSAFVIAVLWGNERFAALRLLGVIFGLAAMVLLIGPEASLPEPDKWVFVIIGSVATICYGLEGNYVARFGLDGLDAVEVLAYSSVLGAIIALPIALATGQFIDVTEPWGRAEIALVALSLLHAVAYSGYIWLVGRTGAVFSAQISYPVTLFGVLASMVLLGERYSGYIWLALGLVLIGLFLVQPRQAER